MKITDGCRTCLLDRVKVQSRRFAKDEAEVERIISVCAQVYDSQKKINDGAALVAGAVHRRNYKEINCDDPYAEIKVSDNLRAEEILKAVSPQLNTVHDYIIASIIGNAIDYGVKDHVVESEFADFFKKMFDKGLAIDDSEEFLKLAERVVYFTDNCGEAVFDKALCRMLKSSGSHVTVVVKDKPMLNDLTLKEAHDIHFEDAADALYSGGGGAQLGTHPQFFSDDVKKAVAESTLIIAKGLANFESLTEYNIGKPTAYLMMVKCNEVAEIIGSKKGDMAAILDRDNSLLK